jgi:hypothetical protein
MAAGSRAAACDLDRGRFAGPLQTLVADGVRGARRSRDAWSFLLPEPGKPALSRAAATASLTLSRDEAIYDRHAAGLYRQALLTLGDTGLAEQVVSDVILDECLRPALPEDHEAAAELRLVISACRTWQHCCVRCYPS